MRIIIEIAENASGAARASLASSVPVAALVSDALDGGQTAQSLLQALSTTAPRPDPGLARPGGAPVLADAGSVVPVPAVAGAVNAGPPAPSLLLALGVATPPA